MVSLRDQILADFAALRVPLSGEQLDEVLRTTEQQALSHLEFLQRLVGTQAQQRRQRAVERRIHDAYFREMKLLEDFDWKFNAATINRARSSNWPPASSSAAETTWSSWDKAAWARATWSKPWAVSVACSATTSDTRLAHKLLQDLTAALADQTLPARLNYWTRFESLIIDEFGFDRLERTLSPQAANLLYKVIDGRSPQRSTGLVTNIDFEAWADYLGDPPLAMAFLDRVVDGAILLKVQGRSYRANTPNDRHRPQRNALLAMPLADLLPIDYAALRAQLPMSHVLELLAFRPMRVRGPQLRGPCPLPDCSSGSAPALLRESPAARLPVLRLPLRWHQLDLWAAVHRLSLAAAAVHLCRVTQTPVPRRLPRPPRTGPHLAPQPTDWLPLRRKTGSLFRRKPQANEVPRAGVRERSRELDRLRRAGQLAPEQQAEMTGLYDQIEAHHVRRIEAAAELAKLWQVSLDSVIDQLGLDPSDDDD